MSKLSELLGFFQKSWGVILILGALLTGGYKITRTGELLLHEVSALRADVTLLQEKSQASADPPAQFPGNNHTALDTTVGGRTLVTWNPIRRLRDDCTVLRLSAFTRDSLGVLRGATPLLGDPIELPVGDNTLSYEIATSPLNAPGKGSVFVQVTYKCQENLLTVTTPHLSVIFTEKETP